MKYIYLLVVISVLGFLIYIISPVGLSDEQIRIVIYEDQQQEQTIRQLKRDDLIRSEIIFTHLVQLISQGKKIDPGAYLLSKRMHIFQLINTLLYNPYQKWVTFIPGLRKEQYAEILAKKFNWDEAKIKEFLDIAQEGYLYPDTYLFNVDYSPKDVAARLTSNFNEKFDAKLQEDLLAQDVRNDTAIKIASLIERESGGDNDKALIAGIIWNRLLKKMKLEIDATIQYALGKPGNWWPKIKVADYRTNSEYNTYIIKSLPQAPIANPSLASIKAVVYPAETDCLYYLHDKNKQIHCAQTYENHLDNINTYLR